MKKLIAIFLALFILSTLGVASGTENFVYTEHTLIRNGISLHLDCMSAGQTDKHILLIHGATYSSHEFDIDYQDYSLVRRLCREGYAVWRLDIAGYGRSGKVEDGLITTTEYAAEDIGAAVDLILQETGQEKIDLFGWSWGTMTTSRYVSMHPEKINRLVLYAPIISGIGQRVITEPFNHNTWEHAADDFQKNEDGTFNTDITEQIMIDLFCSSCWRYDQESSPNGWRVDAFQDNSVQLIDLKAITVPTLVICGDKDPYLNYEHVYASLDSLPAGSELKVIPGAAHAMLYEKPFYQEFQNTIVDFLEGSADQQKLDDAA